MKAAIHLALLLCAVPATAEEWKAFESHAANFRAMFPGTPEHQVNGKGEDQTHSYAAELENTAFIILYSDLPAEDVRKTGADAILQNAQNNAAGMGELTKAQKVTLHDLPGREFHFHGEKDGKKFFAVWQVWLLGNRMYQAGVYSHDKPAAEELVARFQRSVSHLENKPATTAETTVDPALYALGGVAAADVWTSYMAIGAVGDGFAKGTYDVQQVKTIVTVRMDFNTKAIAALNKLRANAKLTADDQAALKRITATYASLTAYGEALLKFSGDKSDANAKQYEANRQAAWANVQAVLANK